MNLVISAAAIVAAVFLFAGCGGAEDEVADNTLNVLTTTGMVADTVKVIGGERVSVTALMGPGVDPHLYKASAGDINRLNRADIIFYNGLFLEGKMIDVLEKISQGGKPAYAVGEVISSDLLRQSQQYEGHPDPHIWFDVGMWADTIAFVAAKLSEIDPEGTELFKANAVAYLEELKALDAYCRERVEEIPEGQRILITAHDAFGYFGEAYGIGVVGLQGINTSSEYGIADVQRLVDLIVENGIRAVFVESSVPRRSIEAVVEGCKARGSEVAIGGELFSDAMGDEGTPEGTYIGMVRHNVDTIVDALK